MSRRVYFSFHYDNDISRVMTVRNSGLTKNDKVMGFIDKAEFETIKRNGKIAVQNWIDGQLKGTSVTIVLVGAETLNRPYVQYEILESLKRGNKIIGISIGNIKDLNGYKSTSQSFCKNIGEDEFGNSIWFDDIIQGKYDYIIDDGYNNLPRWIDDSFK
ncbi:MULTISPECIES: TIR domain-containing protein [Staphylococcus]|uniref:TIR domain-containing protein n=1 Tax=Staphylococcus TaxID=1279 RepID=UPI0008A5B69A|nr:MULTISPECIES: TIR domain-containing protein [Staphylococcus]MDT4012501.1 TIR domain-containing protein [Staphylococcus simulans]OFJ73463.1 molecular chaperone Tir [Staphylococcus sp. HMSC056G08]